MESSVLKEDVQWHSGGQVVEQNSSHGEISWRDYRGR